MEPSKNYYVSAEVGELDIGLAVKAPNVYMAVHGALHVLLYKFSLGEIVIIDVEEVKDDQNKVS